MPSTNRGKIYFYTPMKLLSVSLGVLLTQSTCFYSIDKYKIDSTYIRCDSAGPSCPEGQMCDETKQRCVPIPNVKIQLQLNLAPFTSANIKLNEQTCSTQQPCEATLLAKHQAEIEFTPNDLSKLVSVRNERGEAATCENNRCVITAGGHDETWTATIVNPTFCSSDNWCQMVMNTDFNQIWSPDGQKFIAIGSNGLVVSSMDGGESWRRYVSKDKEDWTTIFGSSNSQQLYIGGGNRELLVSSDGGQSWSLKKPNGLSTFVTRLSGSANGNAINLRIEARKIGIGAWFPHPFGSPLPEGEGKERPILKAFHELSSPLSLWERGWG